VVRVVVLRSEVCMWTWSG